MAEASEEKSNPLKQIRTFQGDIARALSRQRESLVSIHEQEVQKRMGIPAQLEDDSQISKKRQELALFLLGGLAFIFLGILGAWLGYQEFLKRSAPPEVLVPESRLLLSNSAEELNSANANRQTLIAQINNAAKNTPEGELRHFVLTPPITSGEFLQILESKAPGSLVRAFDPVFMAGSFGGSPFIIFQISSFENAFAGMLSWEVGLAEDLGPIFASPEELNVIGAESVFRDIVSRNKDVRALLSGTTTEAVMLYSFFDNKKLILTDNLETLNTLVDRLTQELLSR